MDLAGAIFMCNCETKKECLERKLFGLPLSQSSLVRELKIGMMLFLFEYEKRKLYGVYEATSDGGCNIEPYAFTSSGKAFGAQIRFKTLWSCLPMSEPEFCDAIKDNYYSSNKFKFSLSLDQVKDLLRLFSSRLIKPKLLKSTEIGDGSGSRVSLNATGKQEDSFQTELLKSRERGDGPYRQSGCRVSLNATGPEKDNPLFSSGTSHTLDLQQLSGGYTSGPKVVHPCSRSHFYEPSSGHIPVNTNSRCTDNSSRTCYDDYIALPLSEQCDHAILDTGFFGHRYFEQISPKVDSYRSSAGNEVCQLLNPATISMAGRIIDEWRRNFRCEPHLSLTPYMDAQELKKTTMDPPCHLGSLLQENACDQSPELHNKYYESDSNTCFRSETTQSRQSVFARLSGLPKAQDNEGFDDAESYESSTVVVSLSKALEALGQRMNKWRRKGKYRSSNASNGQGNYVLEDAATEVDRHLTVEVDTIGESDTMQNFELTFLNFKRRSQVKKDLGKTEEEKHGEGGGIVSDGSAGKQKRRKLLRPSFDKEGASYVGDCKNQNLEELFQDKEGASYVGDCMNQNLEGLFHDKEGASYVGDCKNQNL